ncbi:MAG: AraC family transcriptional regulator [Clostridiales bacterium]|nr:AraC family transcriptional regulator [Clostridiales bacterium]MDU3243738.1 AraC family transcriptional regulator [Clostridiales bacterium]
MKLMESCRGYLANKRKDQKQMENRKIFGRIFLGISVSMLVVTLAGSGWMYRMVKKVIIDQNIRMSMQAFSQVQTDFEEANGTANMIATQVMLDDVCSELLTAVSGQKLNSITLSKVRNQLSLYQNTNPEVESIYIYNNDLDLFITSGSRFGAVGKEEYSDQNIVGILENPEKYHTQNLIRRERTTKYPNQTEKKEVVYSYLLYASEQKKTGSVVIVNMKFDKMLQEILDMEILKDSRMLIIDEKNERLVDLQTYPVKETAKMRETVLQMAEKGSKYQEYAVDGEKYFFSYLYSSKSEWNYVKITRWNSMFHVLQELRGWIVGITLTIVLAVVVIALANSVSILKIHRKLEKKYALSTKRSDLYLLREGFLSDFLHNRKLFGKNQLRQQMENFGFSSVENQKYAVLILQLEGYKEFREIYGKTGTYDIKYGFQNIFEETYGKYFQVMGLINRDHTLTFLLETTREDGTQEKIRECFQEFCENVKVFIKWDFSLTGSEQNVNLEKIPEVNSNLKMVMQESFFYPPNTYFTYEQIQREHGEQAEFQQLEAGSLPRAVRSGQDVWEVYQNFTDKLKKCSMMEYMNAIIWLGITVVRSVNEFSFYENDANEFLVRLAACEKASEVDGLFLELFEKIREKQEKAAIKKGVMGKLDEVKKYIEENFTDPNLTLEQLGDEFSVSPNYLGRLFKKDVGMSVADYINGERLKWVLKELEDTERAAKDLAEKCGFVSTNYFYTYFRKKIGVTPQAYREQCREQKENAAVFRAE